MTTHKCPLCGSKIQGSKYGIAHLDGFTESLRLLIERERYSLRDIAAMFSVSGERIRQVAAREGIDTHHKRGLWDYRVWDDTAHRFIPVRKSELARQKEMHRRAARRATYNAKWDAREAQAIAALHTLAVALGRTPTLLELGTALGFPYTNVGAVAARVERYNDARSLWKRAGLEMLPVGHRADELSRKGQRACK